MLENLFSLNTPYVKPHQEKNIMEHKYAGAIDSLYYKHFAGPLADYFTSFMPWTLAPNVITVMGLACVVLIQVT
jgi:ethanolaminephosphotransferase